MTEAPDGAEKSYTLMLDGGSSSPLYQMASKTAAFFKDIGMELKITDIQKENTSGKKPGNKKRCQWIYGLVSPGVMLAAACITNI